MLNYIYFIIVVIVGVETTAAKLLLSLPGRVVLLTGTLIIINRTCSLKLMYILLSVFASCMKTGNQKYFISISLYYVASFEKKNNTNKR